MEKTKQNKNTSVVIRVASATLAIVFMMCILAIPTLADSLNSVSFNNPVPVVISTSNTDRWDHGLSVSKTRRISVSDTTFDVYCFYAENTYYFVNSSLENDTAPTGFVTYPYNSSYRSYTTDSGHINSETELHYSSIYESGFANSITGIPVYNTSSEGFTELLTYINDGNNTVAEFNYSIKPGYALFIDIHGLSDVSGTLYTNTSAAYASPHTSNQTLSYQNSLPSGNVSPQGNGINWQGTGNRDLFGRYKSWNRSLIIQPNSHYIAIYNPVHINTYVDPEHEDFNGNISVHVNKAYSETSILIPLNTELTGTGTVGTNTTDEQKPVVYDENTNSWIPQNSDGTPYTESPYGDYMPSTVNSIHDWLQNIANLISGFFNGAIGAVTTLVGAGSAFINQLVSLYSWLPGPVYAVLSSALILVITIGVIKVFI